MTIPDDPSVPEMRRRGQDARDQVQGSHRGPPPPPRFRDSPKLNYRYSICDIQLVEHGDGGSSRSDDD